MKASLLRELTLYRYRYLIGYSLFVLFLFGLLLTDINSIPYGISKSEMDSAISSNALNPLAPKASDVINLPYHLLQKLSIGLFGLNPISIRLPSLLIGFTASIALAITLHFWFRRGIALLALLLATASVPFITMSRTGTAGVMYMLLLLLILLSAVKLTTKGRRTFVWKVIATAAALSLIYMPLGIYAVGALFIAGILHPHVRYQIKRTKPWQFVVLFFVGFLLMGPIVFAGTTDTGTFAELLGVTAFEEKITFASLGSSVIAILKNLFYFSKPQVGEIMTPFLSLTFVFLILFGLVQVVLHRHSARSYLLLIWLGISVPILVLNPSQFALLFVPCLILMAIGLESFMREWYQLFPRNPYARISAFIPLSLIVIGMLATSSTRYFYGFYHTDTTATYRPELMAVNNTLKPHVKTQLIVPQEQVRFYDILRSKYPLLTVSSQIAPLAMFNEDIVLANTVSQPASTIPSHIETSHLSDNSVLLRVYSRTE